MQALVKRGKGEGNLRIEEVAVPTPGDKDVLIRVNAGAVCGSDLHIMYDRVPCAIPVVIGHEFSGVIEEVGSGVRMAEGRSSCCRGNDGNLRKLFPLQSGEFTRLQGQEIPRRYGGWSLRGIRKDACTIVTSDAGGNEL